MLYFKTRRFGVYPLLLGCALLSGCGGEQRAAGGDGADSASQAPDTRPAESVSAPGALVVQMTGLVLIVPVKNGGGATQLLMPRVPGHEAWIGFKAARQGHCLRYDPRRGICYVNMDGWVLDPVGIAAGSAGAGTGAQSGLLNLSHGSGKKIDHGQARPRLRAQMTLGPGVESEPCSLARWRYKPVDAPHPVEVALVNVMNWAMTGGDGSPVVLSRRRLDGSGSPQELARLAPASGRIELLVMHLPQKEMSEFWAITLGTQGRATSAGPAGEADMAAIEEHFHAFYDLIGVEPGKDKRPIPTDVDEQKPICPITVLGLGRAFGRQGDTVSSEDFIPEGMAGVRTYSCILAAAEPA